MAASTSTSNAADPLSNNSYSYDVFINHRGPDVKKTFASHLYRRLMSHGLTAFLDREELEVGRNFKSQIKDAIRRASIHVAIFSKRYAESKWCLDELVAMVESGAPIIPVFYHVQPSELRWTQTGKGVYARALSNLAKKRKHSQPRHNSDTIEKWRKALYTVAGISGLDLEALNKDEGELLDKVVERVLRMVEKRKLNVAKYPTGLDEKVTDLENGVLSKQHNGRVGITGLGGVGKTTLAKEFFNRKSSNYSKSYFLFDVRENARNSLHSLQCKLIKGLFQLDLHIDNHHEGIEIMRKHLSSCKVFVVLDDVDHVDQVDALFPVDILHDSLILITSRNKDVLARSGVQESSIYKMTGLDRERSTELFCSHAFRQPHPPWGFEDLVFKFVTACQGLPLSLQVFGALLSGNKDKSHWKCHLNRLPKTLPYDIQKSLQISYDALQKEEKQIFLDTACFLIGQYKGTAIRIFNGLGWDGWHGFQSLLNKCLVDVDDENCITMHDHLRDLGRDLANNSLPCRLWRGTKNIDDVLQQSSEAREVRGIKLRFRGYMFNTTSIRRIRDYHDKPDEIFGVSTYDYYEYDDADWAFFSSYKLKKLQFIDIFGGVSTFLTSDDKCFITRVDSPKLIWLRWHDCPLSSLDPYIPMEMLRVLEVDGPDLETLWQDESQAPLELRELRIGAHLSRIPRSIARLKYLEQIVATCPLICLNQENFQPEELLQLPSLKHLQLTGYSTLRSLPDSLGNLRTLKHIDLSYCNHLERLPNSFGNLTNLEYIRLAGCRDLERLPNNFGNLFKLKYLDLRDCCNLTLSCGSFGNISTLEYIDLTGCNKIEVLPSQVAHQRSLERLDLDLPALEEWPNAVGEPSGLKKLILKTPLLETLPDSFGNLTKLEYICLAGCQNLERLPSCFGNLIKLKYLDLSGCSNLTLSSRSLGNISKLEYINLTGCNKIEVLPSQIAHQRSLEKLDLDLPNLKEWPNSIGEPSGLEKLVLKAPLLQKLPDSFENLTKLEYIRLAGCHNLERLPNCFGNLIKLKYLDLRGCSNLTLSKGSFGNISTLEYIDLTGCNKIEVLPSQIAHQRSLETLNLDLPNLKEWPNAIGEPSGLEKLVLKTPLLERLPSTLGRDLRNVKYLELRGCRSLKHLPNSFPLLHQLTKWIVQDCSLPELPFKTVEGESGTWRKQRTLNNLDSCCDKGLLHLQHLELHNTQIAKASFSTGVCPNLQHLEINTCNDLVEVGTLPNALITLTLTGCSKLRKIEGLYGLAKLQTLKISTFEVHELPGIETLVSLEKMQVLQCVKLKSIRGLERLTVLRELDVSSCSELEEMFGVEHLRSLEKLRAFGCKKLESIRGWGLDQLTGLQELDVSSCIELEGLAGVEHLRLLEKLQACDCVKLKSIHGLAQLTRLRELDFSGCLELEALPGVGHLRSLEKLQVRNCVKLKSTQGWGLEQLTGLQELDVSSCFELEELAGVEHLRSLHKLQASDCVKLKSVQGLAQLTRLRELDFSGCSDLEALPSVGHWRSMEKLQARNCVKLKSIRGLDQLRELRDLDVSGCSELEYLYGVEDLSLPFRAVGCMKLKTYGDHTVDMIYNELCDIDVL